MPIVANNPSVAAANLAALNAARGTLQLPRGTIHVPSPVMHTYANSGLRLLGNDTEIRSASAHALCVYGRTLDEVPHDLRAGQVGFVAHRDGDASQNPPVFRRDPEQIRFVGKLPPLAPPPTAGQMWQMSPLLKRAQIVPDMVRGDYGFRFTLSTALPKVGDVVRITDGRYINEMMFDVRRVVALNGRDVLFDPPISRDFHNAAAVFPQEPHNITYEGIRFVGAGGVELKGASRITFNDCDFGDAYLTPINVACCDWTRCTMPGRVQIGTSHDLTFSGCDIAYMDAEEDAHHVRILGGTMGPGKLDTRLGCHSWTIAGVTSTLAEAFIYASWKVTGLTHRGGPIYVRGPDAVLANVNAAGVVQTAGPYYLGDSRAGQGIKFDGVRAAAIVQAPETELVQVDCSVKSEIVPGE